MKELSILEQLCFCTTRIEAVDYKGHNHYGSGFFYIFPIENDGKAVIYLITNRHMTQNMKEIKFGVSKQNPDGSPIYEPPVFQVYGMPHNILYHPNDDIDLCAIPVTCLFKDHEMKGLKLFYKTISSDNIPDKEQWENLEPVEDILLIGYPNALWDEQNNMPLVRKGITATAPYLNYNGKREFVIDAACFPGSSGSPVFICNTGTYRDKQNKAVIVGNRLFFLGILYGGPESIIRGNLLGERNVENIKTVASIPANLGYVIKSDVMADFIPLVEKQIKFKIRKS